MARSRLPGTLRHFAPLATRLLAASGDFETSRQFAQTMLDTAETEDERNLFKQRLLLIDLEEQLAQVDAASQRYHDDHGSFAQTVDDLMTAGYLSEAPVCPFGGVIILRQGRAYSTAIKRLEVRE
jgi:hypothetical protein